MRTLTKSITVKAPAAKVWEVITAPRYVSEWAEPFTPGAKVESDFKTGSAVVWSGDKGVLQRGTVAESLPERSLKLAFPPGQGVDMDHEQIQAFTLKPDGESTQLTATHGPFKDKDYDYAAKPWDQALELIKSLAEEAPGGRTGERHTGTAPRA